MGDVGTMNHEFIGANYAYGLGLPFRTCKLISRHVDAKRYLCFSDPNYHSTLSDASKQTLVYQGGVMSEAEAAQFESDDLKAVIIKMRTWEEQAKVVDLKVPMLDDYKSELLDLMVKELDRRGVN